MALFTLSDLTKPATREDIQTAIYQVFGVLGVNTTSWGTGAVVRTMVVATSAVLAALSSLQANIAASGFMELAEGKWLTLTARYVYKVERDDATYATGLLTLINSGGGVFDVLPGDLLVFNPDPSSGKNYRNVDHFILNAASSLTIAIEAVEAGAASNSAPGAVTGMTTVLLEVTCTNPDPIVGSDEQSDESVRELCREKLGSLSPMGPWDAYAYAARTAVRPTGENIGITRTRVLKDGYGNVRLIVANASGEVGPGDVDIINEDIQHEATPLAVASSTESAVAVPFTVSYEAWVYNTSGNNDEQVRELIRAKVITFFAAQPIGGNLLSPTPPGFIFQEAIRSTIASALQPQIFHVLVTDPAGDTALAVTEVAVLVAFGTEIIHQVPVPEGASL
jgi:phage-related baseplate assembly protein